MSSLREVVRTNNVRFLVGREITCPRTGEVLDVRTCVVLLDSDGDAVQVISQKGWAQVVAEGGDKLLEKTHGIIADPTTVKES